MQPSMLITGGAQGTGYAIAERFAKEGFTIFITERKAGAAAEPAAKLADMYGVPAKGYHLDVYDNQQVVDLFDDIRRQGYLISTVVLNAANLGIGMDPLTVSHEEFMEVFQTNIGWNFSIIQQAAIQMKEAGTGSIVFINSNTAYRAIPNRCAYSASKSGLLGLARSLALDLGPYGIRLNSVVSGMIKTQRWLDNYNNCREAPSNYTPLGDIAEFTDIADAAWYFGSNQSRNTTGAELVVDGGNMIQLYPIIPNLHS